MWIFGGFGMWVLFAYLYSFIGIEDYIISNLGVCLDMCEWGAGIP